MIDLPNYLDLRSLTLVSQMKKGKKNQPKKTLAGKRKRNAVSPPLTRSQRVLRSKSPPQECGICMEPVKQRGLLDSCGHVFCFGCIMKWCKRCSACPHCKRDVSIITKSDVTGKRLQSKHTIRKRVLRDTLDREEFQQRRRQLVARERNSAQNNFLHTANSHSESTQQLLSVHQSIRDNMINRFSSTLRGIQDNLLMLNNMQTQVLPFNLNVCNLPLPHSPLWTDLGFGLNTQQQSVTFPHTTTYFQNQVYSVPNVQQMSGQLSTPLYSQPSTMPQYANMVTEELASTLASLSYHEGAPVFPAEANQNPNRSFQPRNDMDFRYFEN